ncbi:MAG: MAPEG family protein [Caulobacteraceae bacterium]|jgi:glutathione S-transferase
MADHLWTALASIAALLTYFSMALAVGHARTKYDVAAPAISGHPDFERVFRVQANTLEWLPIFLVSLWLFSFYVSDIGAAAWGVVWIIGRVLYLVGYSKEASARSRGFLVQALATAVLLFWSLGVILWRLVQTFMGHG